MKRLPTWLSPLLPYLLGDPNDEGEWQMHCPLHDDRSRSASLNVKDKVWNCFGGCGGGKVKELLGRREEWTPPPNGPQSSSRDMLDENGTTLNLANVRSWNRALLDSEGVMDLIQTKRGLFRDTIKKYRIGYDGRVFTIPIYDPKGKLVNIRFYNMGGRTSSKIWNLKGHGSPARLYPLSALNEAEEFIIICEGEMDALITNQAGFPTITRTAGANEWNNKWRQVFKDRIIYICQDRDEVGERGTIKIGLSLIEHAREVRVIRLPYPVVPNHGKDLTDFWMDRGGTTERSIEQFESLIHEAQLFDEARLQPRDVDPSDADAIDALNAERLGQPLRLTVTVKGKARGGYSLPHKVRFSCTRDAGAMCTGCPMQETDGQGSVEVERSNPAILQMLESANDQVDRIVKKLAGIPQKCPKVVLDKTYQSVEILHVRPSVEHVNGSRAADFTSLRLTSVGRHNTPANCTVQVVGALQANPRSQQNEFLAWDVSELKTLDDEFNIDEDIIDKLMVFRARSNQNPLSKLREIADDVSMNVTHIYGRPHLHAAMDLVWHSVLQFPFRGEILTRGWLELLVVGDTRTGKSEVAQKLIQHYQSGESVNCEAASFAGVVGGTQQLRNEWVLTWGTIPINDRRLVVMDEISGLSPEEIGQMSSVRSSGIAAIEKIVSERTQARTRLIWMGNPRDDIPMAAYNYGVYAVKPLIGRAEDIARFDMAITMQADEIDVSSYLQEVRSISGKYSSDACATLIKWVWTREPEDVHWEKGAEDLVLQESIRLGKEYISDPPLILRSDLRIKIARIAVAIAARLFSTRKGDDLYIQVRHVRAASEFIDSLYSLPSFGYRALSSIESEDRAFAEEHLAHIGEYLSVTEELKRFLLTLSEGRFYARDLEEVLNISREQANGIINKLISARMIQKDRGAVRVLPPLQRLLKDN